MAEKSWSRNNGGYAKHERAIRDGKSGRSNHGDGIMEDESPRRGTGSTQEVPMMHPVLVGTQEAPRRHPGSTQEAHMRFHDTQEALEALKAIIGIPRSKNVKVLLELGFFLALLNV
jgi:hypothetical protein